MTLLIQALKKKLKRRLFGRPDQKKERENKD